MYAEDREHVDRVLAGESDRFEKLVRKYSRFGGAIAYAILGDFQLAEDAVQDSFIKAYRSLATLRQGEKFQAWFGGIVRKRSLDLLRRRRGGESRAVRLDPNLLEAASGDSEAADDLVRDEQREKVLEAVRELPQDDRVVVVLKHMEGLSYQEIAELTSTTVSAVESRLFRARQLLRRRIGQLLKSDS